MIQMIQFRRGLYVINDHVPDRYSKYINRELWCFNSTFQQYSSYIVVISFICGEQFNRSTRRKPQQTLPHNVALSTPCREWDFELTTLVVIGTDCIGSCYYPPTIQS